MKAAKTLDQFYTNPNVANKCWQYVLNLIEKYACAPNDGYWFLEPSAGSGAFYSQMPSERRLGVDIDPKYDGVAKEDFLSAHIPDSKCWIAVGNPPFGKRGSLALEFLNKCLNSCELVAFIVPIQFRKWSIQSKINPWGRLIADTTLPLDAFIFDDKPYNVRCCFQVWTCAPIGRDTRLKSKPFIIHPRFKMWQYNNTKQAEKVFLEEFDFAVPRQGFQDYSIREMNPDKCVRTKQWILFKADTRETMERLMNLDFTKLAAKNISIPGFGKADVVAEYNKLWP